MDVGHTRALFAFLYTIAKASRAQRKAILKTITGEQIKYLTQASYNLLFNSSISAEAGREKNVLKRNLQALKILASKKVPIADKKNLVLKQSTLVQVIGRVGSRYLQSGLK
jgi:hypothetical protein